MLYRKGKLQTAVQSHKLCVKGHIFLMSGQLQVTKDTVSPSRGLATGETIGHAATDQPHTLARPGRTTGCPGDMAAPLQSSVHVQSLTRQ